MKCAHCGKALTEAHTILGMTLGSECVKKYIGLEVALKAAGITFPQEFPMEASGDGFRASQALLDFTAKTMRYGVKIALSTNWSVTPPMDTVTGIRKVDTARITSYIETRAAFAQQLQGGAM